MSSGFDTIHVLAANSFPPFPSSCYFLRLLPANVLYGLLVGVTRRAIMKGILGLISAVVEAAEVNLRPSVYRSICLWAPIRSPCPDVCFLTPVGFLICGALSDERMGLYSCFRSSPEQSFSGPSPAELGPFYCLIWDYSNLRGQVPVFVSPVNRVAHLYPRAVGSFLVASCGPHGCGGGILVELSRVELSWVELMMWPTVILPVWLGVGHPFGTQDQTFLFLFFCRKIVLLFVLGLPLWREDGSVLCSAICQWSESRRTHNRTLLSHLRLLGSLSVASYDSQGLRWKYSYPPPINLPADNLLAWTSRKHHSSGLYYDILLHSPN
jgi:hypothetical protein